MKRLLLLAFLLISNVGIAQTITAAAIHGTCSIGNTKANTQGLASSNTLVASYPQCTVTVYQHGGGLTAIYSDSSLTPLSNPFTATSNGSFIFYANTANTYDIVLTGGLSGGFPSPYTISDVSAGGGSGGGGGGGTMFTVPTQFPDIQSAVTAGAAAGNTPVTVAPFFVPNAGQDTFNNPTALRVFDYRSRHNVTIGGQPRFASEWGVKADAVQVGCVFTAGSTILPCSNANFTPADVGKTVIAYGAGPTGGSAVSTYTAGYSYVSGGTAPTGYPSGTWPQYIEATNGGTSGAACTTPPAGEITVNNGVPSGWVTLFWSGDGCVTPPTTWQISGFTGTSTFSGGTLSTQTLITTIVGFIDAQTVVLAVAPSSSSLPNPNPVSQIVYCTDDTTAWNNMTTAFGSHQGNAHVTFTGGSCISDTVKFENWSGEFSGSGKGNSEVGFQQGLGSYFFWASNTPGGTMLESAGGSGMTFKNFTLIGNASAPPTGIKLTGFTPSTSEQIGAANTIESVNFGVDRGADPNILNYVGYWPITTGIFADAPIGNVDFQRLCWGNGCSFFDVKYPSDKDSDQATGYQWGTIRAFYARVGFCVVGSDQVQEYEGARVQTDINLGSCQYSVSGNTAYYGNGVFNNVSSDADPQLLEMRGGEGSIDLAHGLYGFGAIKNNGVIIDASNFNGSALLIMGKAFRIGGASGAASGFPTAQVVIDEPSQLTGAVLNSIDPTWFPLTNFPVTGLSSQYIATPPLIYDNIAPDASQTHLSIYPNGTDYLDVAQHHYGTDTMGLTQAYGTSYVRKLAPPHILASQISGATPGSTTYVYAGQCRLNNWGTNTGSVGTNIEVMANPFNTGAATLTSVNANGIFMQYYALGCDGYYIYLFTGGAYKCLAKSGACVEFTQKTSQGYIAIDDGSYTYLSTPDADGTGVQKVDTGYQVGGQWFAQARSLNPAAKGSQLLADFSYQQAIDGQAPLYSQAQNQYIPGSIAPSASGLAAVTGGIPSTGGYTSIGAHPQLTPNNQVTWVAFTPGAATSLTDVQVRIGATAAGSGYWFIADSNGTDITSAGGAPGTVLCSDVTGHVLVANSWNVLNMTNLGSCPYFASGHKYFVGFVPSVASTMLYDSPGFSGTSYFISIPSCCTVPSPVTNSNQNANIFSLYVDLATVYKFSAIPPVTLTTTAAASDNVTITGMTSSGHCTFSAAGSGAAAAATNIATTYISAKTTNQITVSHAVIANMTYDIMCTPN